MRDRQERLDHVLGELSKVPGVLGASLVSRDGLAVRHVGKQELRRETFSAMSATLMGAAEIALGEVAPDRARFIVAQTASARMVVVGATADLLLIVLADHGAKLDDIVAQAETAAKGVASTVTG